MFKKLIATAAVVSLVGAGTATAAPTAQGVKADGLRLTGLAQRYQELHGYTPAALRADGLRWQAMARACPPLGGRSRATRTRELRVLLQDLSLELLQLGAGLEAELLTESAAGALVGVEGVTLASGAVEGAHELGVQAFAQGIGGDERFQLGDQPRVPARLHVCVDAVLEHGEAFVFEASAGLVGEPLVAELDERGAAPERERVGGPAVPGELVEAVEVELAGLEVEEVAGRARLEPAVAERLA